jgi:large subunit ribosomal protein L14
MVQHKSVCEVADNTGVKKATVVMVYGGTKSRTASLGDIVRVVVKASAPDSKLTKGSMHKAVVVRTRRKVSRSDGSEISFDDNAVVIIGNDTQEPVGTRIFGPVARELRAKGFLKIISLAPEVL